MGLFGASGGATDSKAAGPDTGGRRGAGYFCQVGVAQRVDMVTDVVEVVEVKLLLIDGLLEQLHARDVVRSRPFSSGNPKFHGRP